MKNSEILQQAYELIKEPGTWTQGEFARDGAGHHASEYGDAATCFCSLGAIHRVIQLKTTDPLYRHPVQDVLREAIHYYVSGQIPSYAFDAIFKYNDSHTHEEVLTMFRKAIELAKADEDGIS